jgi:hypothetical protein
MSEAKFTLGGFGPKLSDQGLEPYLSAEDIAHFDRDDEAISRLHVRGLIPYSVHVKARQKLAAKIRAAVKKANP